MGLLAVGADSDELLGSVGLIQVDLGQRRAEAGFWTAPWARRGGVASRAIRLLARWSFEVLDLARVQAMPRRENEVSQRILERAGFVREGLLRSYVETKGERWEAAGAAAHSRGRREQPGLARQAQDALAARQDAATAQAGPPCGDPRRGRAALELAVGRGESSLVIDVYARSSAPRDVVWRVIADPRRWANWGPSEEAGLEREGEPATDGVGAIRRLRSSLQNRQAAR